MNACQGRGKGGAGGLAFPSIRPMVKVLFAGARPMYLPTAFREDDLAALHQMMRDARLANLVTATDEGLIATPLPMIVVPDEGAHGTLYGHVARANPQWKRPPIGEAMALFMGPDAYVSPSWYASKQVD